MKFSDTEVIQEIDWALGYAERREWPRFWSSAAQIRFMLMFTERFYRWDGTVLTERNREIALTTLHTLRDELNQTQ